jgi:hypothetical protein
MAYTSSQIVQAVPTGINSAFVCVKAETAFTSASSVTADNVFSSAYTNYRIMIRFTSAGNMQAYFRLRVGGVTSTAANYNWQRITGVSTTAGASRTTSTTFFELGNGVNGAFFSTNLLEVSGPFLTEPTTFQNLSQNSDGAYTTPTTFYTTGNNTLSTSFDGFEFLPVLGAGTVQITGTYTVYGYGKTV